MESVGGSDGHSPTGWCAHASPTLKTMDEVTIAFRFALGTIFLLSGVAKLANSEAFEEAVREYRAVPESMSRRVARVVPPAETALGVCLVLGVLVRPVALVSAVVLLAFTFAIALNLVRGRRIACGCFGTISSREVSWFAVARNVCLIGFALVVAISVPTVLAVDGWIELGEAPTSVTRSDAVAMLIVGTSSAFTVSILQESVSVARSHRKLMRSLAGVP